MPLNTSELIDKSYRITHGRLDLRQNYQTHYHTKFYVTNEYNKHAINEMLLALKDSNFWTIDKLLDYVYAQLFKYPEPKIVLPLNSELIDDMTCDLVSTSMMDLIRDK